MGTARQSRNHLVLVVVLVLVIEDPTVEDENEDEDENENICRICVNLHDCSTDGLRWTQMKKNRRFLVQQVKACTLRDD